MEGEHNSERDVDVLCSGYYFLRDAYEKKAAGSLEEMNDPAGYKFRVPQKGRLSLMGKEKRNSVFSYNGQQLDVNSDLIGSAYHGFKKEGELQEDLKKINLKPIKLFNFKNGQDNQDQDHFQKLSPEDLDNSCRHIFTEMRDSLTPKLYTSSGLERDRDGKYVGFNISYTEPDRKESDDYFGHDKSDLDLIDEEDEIGIKETNLLSMKLKTPFSVSTMAEKNK